MSAEDGERARVIACARGYLRTPYHHAGRVKGVGVDCLTLLACAFEDAGLVPRIEIPHYPHDWHLHKGAERYLDGLLNYTREVDSPRPGDIALWKFGRCYSHGAIVVRWPRIIHAYVRIGCVEEDAGKAVWLSHIGENVPERGKPRPRGFFSFWGR